MKVGLLALGRPTFDVPFAEENFAAMLATLDQTGHQIIGPRSVLFDADATQAAIAEVQAAGVDRLLIMQVTFTDAAATVEACNAIDAPVCLWAIPEPRIGGRLRLNSFCGLNLASHALGLSAKTFGWLYADPATLDVAELNQLIDGARNVVALPVPAPADPTDEGIALAKKVQGKRIARLGAHPDGFHTCAYDADALQELAGVTVDAFDIDHLFAAAKDAADDAARTVREQAAMVVTGLDDVDQGELDKSLKLKVALDDIRTNGNYDAFAIRCWPETFTEYGGAVCGPASMLGEARVPCACEADVYGALTQLVLQEVAGSAVFLADVVDMDAHDNTGVVWHCGQAPASMCGSDATATIHTNRKMPLLFEFTLKPGRVTMMRISQAQGTPKMILSSGEVLARPMSFTGTSGVVRFDNDAAQVTADVMNSGLEHHIALAYGDHRDRLKDVAAAMKLPVVEI